MVVNLNAMRHDSSMGLLRDVRAAGRSSRAEVDLIMRFIVSVVVGDGAAVVSAQVGQLFMCAQRRGEDLSPTLSLVHLRRWMPRP